MQFPAHLWRTSTYTDTGGQCVEVAMTDEVVGVRDTKNRAGGHIEIPAAAFTSFVSAIKRTNGWR